MCYLIQSTQSPEAGDSTSTSERPGMVPGHAARALQHLHLRLKRYVTPLATTGSFAPGDGASGWLSGVLGFRPDTASNLCVLVKLFAFSQPQLPYQ